MPADAPTPPQDVEAALAAVAGVPGWMTDDQARALHAAAAAVPAGGTVVEIGSHHGRSTVVLASGLAEGARLVAIDPFGPDWRYGADGTEAACRATLAAAGVTERVDVRVATSAAVRAGWQGPVDLLYVDGAHDHASCRDDLRWAEHVPPGGTVLVHDAFSSVGVTTALFRQLPLSGSLRYVGRTGSLAHLQVARPTVVDRLRPFRELPWWVRNLAVKVLLRLRLRGVATLLGHHGEADPY